MAVISNEILILLDKNLKRVGTISPFSDKNPFWGETIKRQIADDSASNDSITALDTFNRTDPNANSKMWGDEISGLTMTKDAPMAKNLVIGNSIARYNKDIDKWIIYRIITTDEAIDEVSGRHLVTIEAVNLAIWHLGKTIPAQKEIKEANIEQAMGWILAGSGWTLENNSESGLLADMQFDGSTSSQSYLQNVLTTYDCEAQAYAHFDAAGLVDDLVLELTDHLGVSDAQKTVRYGKNMKSVHRKTVDTTLITKLYVYGAGGGTIQSVNNGKDFITDSQANAIYNNDQNTWLEGAITSQTIKQPAGLMAWGAKQLRLYNHPRVNYTVEVSPDFNPNLGDEVKVIDTEMTPDLTVQARVIQKEESLSNPYSNTVTLGEFATVKVVTPSFIKSLQDQYNDEAKRLFEKAREDSTASTVSLITPLGRSWYNDDKTKKCIARLFIEGINVTSYLTPDSFNWQYIQQDGSHNFDWEQQHKHDGYEVVIEPGFVGTLLCSINDEHNATQGEIWIDSDVNNVTNSTNPPSNSDGQNSHSAGDFWVQTDTKGNALSAWQFTANQGWQTTAVSNAYNTRLNPNGTFKKLWQSHYNTNKWGDTMYGAIQCAQFMGDGNVLGSYAYRGKQSLHQTQKKDITDTEFIRFNANGDLLDAMILHAGGHGSSFSYNPADQLIYTVVQDINGNNSWRIGALPYKPNQEATLSDFVWSCELGKFLRPSFQFDSVNGFNYMMGSNMDGTVIVCKTDDLKAGNFTPLIQCKLQDFGINPSDNKGSVDGTTNTMQSNGLFYPFAFFTMGDVNNKDDRQILCINLITQSKEFLFPLEAGSNIHLDIPTEAGGHFEPEGVYYDSASNGLIVGFNLSEYTDSQKNNARPMSTLFSIPLSIRTDVISEATKYPADDNDLSIQSDMPFQPSDGDFTDDDSYDISYTTPSSNPLLDSTVSLSVPGMDTAISDMSNPNYLNVYSEGSQYVYEQGGDQIIMSSPAFGDIGHVLSAKDENKFKKQITEQNAYLDLAKTLKDAPKKKKKKKK